MSGQQPSEAATLFTTWGRSFQVSLKRVLRLWRKVVFGLGEPPWLAVYVLSRSSFTESSKNSVVPLASSSALAASRAATRVFVRHFGPLRRVASCDSSRSERSMRAARAVASRAFFPVECTQMMR